VTGLDSHAGGIPAGARAVAGDLGDPAVRAEALANGCDALVHLATVPGGAAEADPKASRRINIDAMYDLLEEAAKAGQRPRVVYASSIAVLGEHLPRGGVDDGTPLSPHLTYGGHKAMMEVACALLSNRGSIRA
jgi:nucleoside-diphosphate-sugar epimerase